ncbi:helix-turn-helix domain-containing protein [Novosphingobium percolationis]|uniref:hypothetical protein n=1 Tax=Novosphingobium percolationis TaxID=2871811 RepID=UPI001CD42500|nr:hypothetical protein [Novosphingobium percolationis]
MTARKTKANAANGKPINLTRKEGESDGEAIARNILGPGARHGVTHAQVMQAQMGSLANAPDVVDYAKAVEGIADKGAAGDLDFASRLLAAQAVTLDSMFTELARRMALNMGEHLHATEIYARIALKAQANSRATIEALAKLHQPREQTVRHVHVNDGGQAVIADQFHHHQHDAQGGTGNGQSSEQPHAQGAPCPALPCPNPIGPAVPLARDQGQEPVQDARRKG